MIAPSESPLFVRAAVWLAWRGERRIATKLHGFAATELGSALDMFRAAELATDPDHRRLFFRHALDESRHAARFKATAEAILPGSKPRALEREHAVPQDLYRRLGEERFLAFVHLSEARAARHFEALARHFSRREGAQGLATLFTELHRDERVHVAYSRHLLERRFALADRARMTRRALRRERRALAWAAWKRAGFRLGDRAVALLMLLAFAVVMPLFVPFARLAGHARPGWHPAPVERAPTRVAKASEGAAPASNPALGASRRAA